MGNESSFYIDYIAPILDVFSTNIELSILFYGSILIFIVEFLAVGLNWADPPNKKSEGFYSGNYYQEENNSKSKGKNVDKVVQDFK